MASKIPPIPAGMTRPTIFWRGYLYLLFPGLMVLVFYIAGCYLPGFFGDYFVGSGNWSAYLDTVDTWSNRFDAAMWRVFCIAAAALVIQLISIGFSRVQNWFKERLPGWFVLTIGNWAILFYVLIAQPKFS